MKRINDKISKTDGRKMEFDNLRRTFLGRKVKRYWRDKISLVESIHPLNCVRRLPTGSFLLRVEHPVTDLQSPSLPDSGADGTAKVSGKKVNYLPAPIFNEKWPLAILRNDHCTKIFACFCVSYVDRLM